MIFALIVFLLVVVFFAFFIGKNLTNVCTFWFFKNFTELPVSVLVLIAFGVGIVFSILVFIIAKVKQSSYKEIVVTKKEKPIKQEKAEKNEKTGKTREKIEKKERSFRKKKASAVKVPVSTVQHETITSSSEDVSPADNK